MSDRKLTDILKSWGFKAKSLGTSRGWEAPLLPKLRAEVLAKYPAVEFDDLTDWATEWPDYDDAAVRDAVAKESEQRQAAVQEAIARQTTAGQVEVRDLAARQAVALQTAKAEREAAEREKAAKEEAATPDAIRQFFAATKAKQTDPAPPESASKYEKR
jgi:hypothetical protein